MDRVAKAKAGLWLVFAFYVVSGPVGAVVYQTEQEFVREIFGQSLADAERLWLRGELKARVSEILGHDYAALRLRYWRSNGRSLWILEEIGKERPITLGLVVGSEGVEHVRVLTYRESRGYEVRFPHFLRQFDRARMDDAYRLDRNIDGISGATLSVRAVTQLVRMALYLHAQLPGGDASNGG